MYFCFAMHDTELEYGRKKMINVWWNDAVMHSHMVHILLVV